jgi:uncharacterized protein YegP (UPF0339 family)
MGNTAKFYIKKQINGQYYYTLVSANNETILKGEGYTSKQNCLIGIQSVKKNSPYDSKYDKKTTSNGTQYYFTLKVANGEPIGVSEMYNSTYSRDNGIAAVKRDAPNASIVDLT